MCLVSYFDHFSGEVTGNGFSVSLCKHSQQMQFQDVTFGCPRAENHTNYFINCDESLAKALKYYHW